jgi:hypothetical protein
VAGGGEGHVWLAGGHQRRWRAAKGATGGGGGGGGRDRRGGGGGRGRRSAGRPAQAGREGDGAGPSAGRRASGHDGRDGFEMAAVQKNEEEGDLRYKGGRRHRSWRRPPDTCQRCPGVGAKIYDTDAKTSATSSCHIGMFCANVIGTVLR